MPQNEGYIRWPTNQDIPLTLALFDESGAGVTGATPEVSIRRYKETRGAVLDNWYWDDVWFSAPPTWFPMDEIDAVNSPGLYVYLFEQTKVGIEQIYTVYVRNTAAPEGFAIEQHIITNEVYIPSTQPAPIVIGPGTVKSMLARIMDGGTGLFEDLEDSLHFLRSDMGRVMALMHRNAIVDNQQYDANTQLTSARLRGFDSAANVPAAPGGAETTGLVYEFEVYATYAGLGVLTSFGMKQVL